MNHVVTPLCPLHFCLEHSRSSAMTILVENCNFKVWNCHVAKMWNRVLTPGRIKHKQWYYLYDESTTFSDAYLHPAPRNERLVFFRFLSTLDAMLFMKQFLNNVSHDKHYIINLCKKDPSSFIQLAYPAARISCLWYLTKTILQKVACSILVCLSKISHTQQYKGKSFSNKSFPLHSLGQTAMFVTCQVLFWNHAMPENY